MCISSLSYSPIQRVKTSALILARTIITSYSDKDNDKIRSFSFMGKRQEYSCFRYFVFSSVLEFFAEITGGSN